MLEAVNVEEEEEVVVVVCKWDVETRATAVTTVTAPRLLLITKETQSLQTISRSLERSVCKDNKVEPLDQHPCSTHEAAVVARWPLDLHLTKLLVVTLELLQEQTLLHNKRRRKQPLPRMHSGKQSPSCLPSFNTDFHAVFLET
jgi:hypothetical protein